MSPLEKLKMASGRPLGVHSVQTPELAANVEFDKNATDEEKAKILASLETQLLAELSGVEMDSFVEIWSSIRDEADTDLVLDYRRVAIAFCWCDKERTLQNTTKESVLSVVKILRTLPATLTSRMFTVANGANAFAGIDDDTKKNSRVATKPPTSKISKPGKGLENGA